MALHNITTAALDRLRSTGPIIRRENALGLTGSAYLAGHIIYRAVRYGLKRRHRRHWAPELKSLELVIDGRAGPGDRANAIRYLTANPGRFQVIFDDFVDYNEYSKARNLLEFAKGMEGVVDEGKVRECEEQIGERGIEPPPEDVPVRRPEFVQEPAPVPVPAPVELPLRARVPGLMGLRRRERGEQSDRRVPNATRRPQRRSQHQHNWR